MFKKKEIVTPEGTLAERGVYFVSTGEEIGCFLLHLSELSNVNLKILAKYPEGNKVEMSPDEVRDSLKKGILDFVEVIPKKVYKVCLAQHTKEKSK